MPGIAVVVIADVSAAAWLGWKPNRHLERGESSKEQAGADQQDAGKRDFTDDEESSGVHESAGLRSSRGWNWQGSTQIRGGDRKAGREAEERAAARRDERSPEKVARQFHGAEKRKREGALSGDEADDAISENQAE